MSNVFASRHYRSTPEERGILKDSCFDMFFIEVKLFIAL